MSLEATIVKAFSLNSNNKSIIRPQGQSENPQILSENQEVNENCSLRSSDRTETSESGTQTPTAKPKKSQRYHRDSNHSDCTHQSKTPAHSQSILEKILSTVAELEQTLLDENRYDFRLRMALERQTVKVKDLSSSLENERGRNQRLVKLIRGVDSASSTDDEAIYKPYSRPGMAPGYTYADRGQSRSSFESISPLLMQQRYDELSMSHNQCRRQLVKKEKLLTAIKCEKEEILAKYDHLLDEYRNVQKRCEELCCKYLRLQTRKNQEIQKLRDALTYASDLVISAQHVMDLCVGGTSQHDKQFRQNLQSFIKALRLCEWVQSSCRRSATVV